ncbi:carboxy terminal-processing peptidase [Blattabacterium sp. (Blaberus giganteus)]|uniref:carboxy terminal-processing peptidase n=1 Tax=Blattabacterium sp. (Blaberus giganteus) TaxID=1186051 RepID=UPI00025F6E86|nr:carboxy terminal-processing peptidase [Blattabacterium sp. (Blaberus giganteus)]AFJ90596.1 protease [Blattabacterium sp. (Blaberus giganteus)]
MNLKKIKKLNDIKYIIIGFILFFSLSLCSPLGEQEKHRIVLKTIYKTLNFLHPKPIYVGDDFSQKVYNEYFEKLDYQKRFFLQKDVEDLSLYKEKIDDFWIHGDLTFFNVIMKRFFYRVKEVESICIQILKTSFNFNKKEMYILEEQKFSYPKNKKECIEKWRKYLKYLTLLEIITSINQKKITSINQKKIWKNAFFNKEKNSRKKVEEYIKEYFRKLKIKKKSDWFSTYVNTITSQYDPHTNYFSYEEKKNFDLNISGQTEGIGVKLQDDKGYPTIVKLIVGGPAWKNKKIEIGDKIIRVAKNINSESKNVVGMLLENSIFLIRGKKGSKVKLTIQKKNGSIEEVILIRDIIEKKEIFAKSVIILDKNQNKYGLICLPEFYFNPENKNGKNSAKDMKKIIQELKKENIKGIIIDIRNNGGGSLNTVIEIAGFFLGKVPIVQIGKPNQKKNILKSHENKIIWTGPLVVLVNELSASASEILAAAIIDYKRGIIVGSSQTYGKGTIQTIYPLNRFLFSNEKFSNEKLGALKFTINKFYRVNGNSTQLKGVNSDIVIPSNTTSILLKYMEKNKKNPMKWDYTSPIPSIHYYYNNLENIKHKSIERLKKNKNLITINETIQSLEKKLYNKKRFSLNWKEFYYENLKIKKRNENLKKLKNYFNIYGLQILPSYYKIISNEKKSEEQKKWKKNLKEDFYITECINILRDFNEIP